MKSLQVLDAEGNNPVSVELQVGRTILRREDLTLAQCVSVPVVNEVQFLRSNGEYFAKLVQGGLGELTNCPNHEEPLATWTIQTHVGVAWFFFGDFGSSAIEVRDNLGRLVAKAQKIEGTMTSDQPGKVDKAYLLRIAPMMDGSIAIFGILAVNNLLKP